LYTVKFENLALGYVTGGGVGRKERISKGLPAGLKHISEERDFCS